MVAGSSYAREMAPAPMTIISIDGSHLSSIFMGTLFKPAAYESSLVQSPRACPIASNDMNAKMGGGLIERPARLKTVSCDSPTVCAGHYVYIVRNIPGGCYRNACPVNGGGESTILAAWEDGGFDSYCSAYCCVTTNWCFNGDPNDGL